MHSEGLISRRVLLRGIGASLTLPLLDMSLTTTAAAAPTDVEQRRLAYLYFPNGVAEGAWEPRRVGPQGQLLQLNPWMQPLEPFRDDLIIPHNLWTPRGNGHGAGTATWLTGGGYNGTRIDAGGMSVDQLVAGHLRNQTLLPSLELSLEGEGFFSNSLPRNAISWSRGDRPQPRDTRPRAVFDRMFRSQAGETSDRSVLDLVLEDARRLKREVGAADQRQIDEYLEAVRSVEKRVAFAESRSQRAGRQPALQASLRRPPAEIPDDHREYVRLMLDMIVLAFWADATRVATLMLDHGQSNRYFNFIDGVQGTWHALSHWRDASGETEDDDGRTSWSSVKQKREMYNRVVHWHHEQVAYFLGRLRSIKHNGTSLLDNCMVVYGSSLSDGHEHSEDNLPVILAGGGGGTIRSGRQIAYRRETSLSRLHLSLLQRMGVERDRFADASRPLAELDA